MSNKTSKPLLVVFIGFPGSGKTYFAKQLADKLHAVRFSSDAVRVAMFGSLEKVEVRKADNSLAKEDVMGVVDYAALQTLSAGYSVVYDAEQPTRERRLKVEQIANETRAVSVLVWVKADREVAIERGINRQADSDSHNYSREQMAYLIDRFDRVTDLPGADENVIEISGEVTFDEQYREFQKQLDKYL